MDETRLRAIIREEIALAMKTLRMAAGWVQPGDRDALDAIRQTVTTFEHVYPGECRTADEQRAQDAENPFEETAPAAVGGTVKALVRAEVLGVLKDMRSAFYMSGYRDDYQIAERLDGVIREREAADE